MIKALIKKLLVKKGYEVRKFPFGSGSSLFVEEASEVPPVESTIVESIFNFFAKIPPFYNEDVRSELRIGGNWKSAFEPRRKNQLSCLSSLDVEGYASLLNCMFRNELISGLWVIGYYNNKILGSGAPQQFVHNLENFLNLTGLNINVLDDGNFGGKWGVRIDNSLITFIDPSKGLNAFNSANFLNANCGQKATYLDLGSGYGSDVIKVEKMAEMPLRTILCDLPLNLTTAFAYVSMNTRKRCVLIDSESALEAQLSSNFSESEFIFVPTIFIEKLAESSGPIDLLFNHGSFSEMDYNAVKFYLDTLLLNGPVKAMFEINGNVKFGPHRYQKFRGEVLQSSFPIPDSFKLLKRNLGINNYYDGRLVENLYVRAE
jgi:hypothetical protein